MKTSQKIVPACAGCYMQDDSNGTCTAFVDPAFQHRGGHVCWGRCDSADELARRLDGIKAYSGKATGRDKRCP